MNQRVHKSQSLRVLTYYQCSLFSIGGLHLVQIRIIACITHILMQTFIRRMLKRKTRRRRQRHNSLRLSMTINDALISLAALPISPLCSSWYRERVKFGFFFVEENGFNKYCTSRIRTSLIQFLVPLREIRVEAAHSIGEGHKQPPPKITP